MGLDQAEVCQPAQLQFSGLHASLLVHCLHGLGREGSRGKHTQDAKEALLFRPQSPIAQGKAGPDALGPGSPLALFQQR